jgi:hypothetical protein
MPTPFRTALAEALRVKLASDFPTYTVTRAQRAELSAEERPALRIETGDADPDYELALGSVVWSLRFTVFGYPVASSTDAAAEDALATLEAAIIGFLQNRTLSGVTTDILSTGSSINLVASEFSAACLGDVAVGFTARLWLPSDSANL